MATITEDYCSFEVAKLLKEKGFDAECRAAYTNYGKLFTTQIQQYITNALCSRGYLWDCTAPTLQMAMKWLREDKKILISIFCHIDKGYWFCIQHFIDSPYKFATSESIHRKEEILGKIQYYDTYEQACEAAIKYCLEHLI